MTGWTCRLVLLSTVNFVRSPHIFGMAMSSISSSVSVLVRWKLVLMLTVLIVIRANEAWSSHIRLTTQISNIITVKYSALPWLNMIEVTENTVKHEKRMVVAHWHGLGCGCPFQWSFWFPIFPGINQNPKSWYCNSWLPKLRNRRGGANIGLSSSLYILPRLPSFSSHCPQIILALFATCQLTRCACIISYM